jgi:hypothetical protein
LQKSCNPKKLKGRDVLEFRVVHTSSNVFRLMKGRDVLELRVVHTSSHVFRLMKGRHVLELRVVHTSSHVFRLMLSLLWTMLADMCNLPYFSL